VQQLVNNLQHRVTAREGSRALADNGQLSMNVPGCRLSVALPVLPELVLAVGAMVLLMLGAYSRQDDALVTNAGNRAAGRHPACWNCCCQPASSRP